MRFPSPLIPAILVRRYKRFLADVELADGTITTVHCPNPGGMIGLQAPGSKVWLSRANNPKRKLPLTFELIEVDGGLVGINTGLPNKLVPEALALGLIPELAGYESVKAEVPYGRNSRVDLLLSGSSRPTCYVEIKNVHLKRDPRRGRGPAEFPDAVTTRGAKHLVELAAQVALGQRAVMLYVVQRGDCDSFRIAGDIDPGYEAGLRAALGAGVEAICYSCRVTVDSIEWDRALPIELGPIGSGPIGLGPIRQRPAETKPKRSVRRTR